MSVVSKVNVAEIVQEAVIFTGDLNVAHTEDDLANPKENEGEWAAVENVVRAADATDAATTDNLNTDSFI